MRVRDHLALTTAGAALLGPRLGRGAFGLWIGGVLIDVDHYVWFCVDQRRCDPVAAVRFFNGPDVPLSRASRLLHHPAALILMAALGVYRRRALPLVLGMAAHIASDHYHEGRMSLARETALRRDAYVCQGCGSRSADIAAHLRQQPWLLPSYGPQNLVSLCSDCHRLAHVNGNVRWN